MEDVHQLPLVLMEVGEENAFIFGLSSDEVINYENNGGYDPMQIFNSDKDIQPSRHITAKACPIARLRNIFSFLFK